MSKARLLIADDDPEIRQMLQRLCEKHGYAVATAADGREALASAQRDKPDMILLDIMMPHMDGRDVLRKLKEDAATRDIPVVIISARDDQVDRLVGLQLGAEDYIDKPFHLEMIAGKIERILWRRQQESKPG